MLPNADTSSRNMELEDYSVIHALSVGWTYMLQKNVKSSICIIAGERMSMNTESEALLEPLLVLEVSYKMKLAS